MDKDKALELIPSRGAHPIVDMAVVAIQEGANPEAVIENMVTALVDELNRYRPLAPETGNHTHYHNSYPSSYPSQGLFRNY